MKTQNSNIMVDGDLTRLFVLSRRASRQITGFVTTHCKRDLIVPLFISGESKFVFRAVVHIAASYFTHL